MSFQITDHVEFNASGRAACPSCAIDGKGKKLNLALVPNTDGAYKCHRGCTPEEIRQALGQEKTRTTPISQQPKTPPKSAQATPQQIEAAHEKLLSSNGSAKKWLRDRGIDDTLITEHKLGINQVRVGLARHYAISIPIIAAGEQTYHLKKRVEPWNTDVTELPEYSPWKQYGVPKMVWFTHYPEYAKETWLCEGEWDAMLLGKLVRDADKPIAIASFTCGCSSVPPKSELEKLPGKVTVFYDRNDKPHKNGSVPGDDGANKVASALGNRGFIGKVPMPEGNKIHGWDVSDAVNDDYLIDDFIAAASVATKPKLKASSSNSLMNSLIWNDDLIENAPDYTEFLVPDLLTEDELFLLAAGPRTGKSLMAMTLAQAVASGGQFMGRPCTQGTVVYVKCEDSHTKIKEREQAQGWTKGLPVAWLDDFKLSNVEELEELIAELDPRLLVLDTLSRIKDSPISESSAEMSQLLEPLQRIANKYGCCVVLVHHTGKVNVDNANQIDIFDTIRGSSAIRAVCRGSMVLAAGEQSYRLVVENGWGKHDLKVVLDANTLTWKQLGEWSPPVNMSQQELIVDALKKIGSGSVEAIHDETGIPKKSLYQQLSRLVNSSDSACKVVKEGTKRKYTYRLALFNTIQQLNSVLNSPKSDSESVRPPIQQNTFFPENSLTSPKFDQEHVPVEVVKPAGQTVPPTNTGSVEYNPSEPYAAKENTIQHAIQQYATTDTALTTGESSSLSNDVTVEKSKVVEVGSRVYYTGSNGPRARICGRKKLTVESLENDIAVCNHKGWKFTQSIDVTELAIA